MDILLFNQFFSSPKSCPNRYLSTLPLNLLSLASYLKVRGIPSKIIELGSHKTDRPIEVNGRVRFGLSDNTIISIIKSENPKIIGIGCMYSRHYRDVLYLTRLIKSFDEKIITVIGGNHATSYLNRVVNEANIDFIVVGEGEITFFELCQRILNGGVDFKDIKGLAFRNNNNEIVKTQQRELIKNLDDLPISDFTLIDMNAYLQDAVSPFLMRPPSFSVISSRGCPGKCVFCTVKNVWGRTWRGRSAKHFVDEIQLLYDRYSIKEFGIMDDTASLDKERWVEICNEIIKRKLDIKWTTPNGIAHWTLNESIIRKMKESGCYRITFGIESGSPETRRFIRKSYDLKGAANLIRFANRIGMWTICTNILGFPYETKTAVDETIKYAKTCGTDFATFFLLCPDMTSDVYSYFKKEKLLDFEASLNSSSSSSANIDEMERALSEEGVTTCHFTSKQLKKTQMQAYRGFMLRRGPSFLFTLRLARKIKSFEDFLYAMRLIAQGIKIFRNSFLKTNTMTLLHD
ncbi:B12-binding domain-containing radical SAM protein [Thermoproteota archaeon]